jgi:hypothetical protein
MQDGSSYQGEWKEGKFDGQGVWTWRDGRRFEGLFSKDHPVEGVLNYEGASRNVTWDTRTGTFVTAEQASGIIDTLSPRRWSGTQKSKSVAADAATPPTSSVALWGICTTSRKDATPNSARSHYEREEEEMPPLPIKETWCPPANSPNNFADQKRRLCAWAGFL